MGLQTGEDSSLARLDVRHRDWTSAVQSRSEVNNPSWALAVREPVSINAPPSAIAVTLSPIMENDFDMAGLPLR